MTQDNGPEELEGENPFLEDITTEFLLEHAKRTGDRGLIDKGKRQKKKKRTIGGGRIYTMFVTPVINHYRRGMDALIEIHTQISRWEREPGWFKPDFQFPGARIGMVFPGREYPGTGWERISPFRGLEDPRIASKLQFANEELYAIQKILASIPEQPELRGMIPIAGWFAIPVRDPLTGETGYEPTEWAYGALDELE